MKKIIDYFSIWHSLLVCSLIIIIYLITISFSEARAIYSIKWPTYESDGCVILNLHWADGEITVNNIKKVFGIENKAARKVTKSSFFYTLLSEDGATMKAEYFKIPKTLHYDYFDESTGKLTGGQLQRDEVDFVIRVPNFTKAKQLMFYKSNRSSSQNDTKQKMLLEKSDECEILGEINLNIHGVN